MKSTRTSVGLITLCLLMMTVMETFAQQKSSPQKETDDNKVYKVVEHLPYFRSDTSWIDVKAILDFVSEHIQYPKDALEAEKQGTVICEFVINKDGSISEIKVKRGLYPSLDKEAVRVIGSFPKWHPGKQEGKKVRVLYTLPIVFRIR